MATLSDVAGCLRQPFISGTTATNQMPLTFGNLVDIIQTCAVDSLRAQYVNGTSNALALSGTTNVIGMQSGPAMQSRTLHRAVLGIQTQTSLCFLDAITQMRRQHCAKPTRRAVIAAGVGRTKIPRPTPETVEEKRAERAVGGSVRPSAPRGSLFALELKAQRHSPDEQRQIHNRFPFKDG